MKANVKMAVITFLLLVVITGGTFGFIWSSGMVPSWHAPWIQSTQVQVNNSGGNPCAAGQVWQPTAAVGQQCQVPNTSNSGSNPACSAGQVTGPAISEAGVADGMTKAALTSSTNFYTFTGDHINIVDTNAISAAVHAGAVPLVPGTPYAFEAESTGGNGYYPGWFTLHAGWTNCSPIYYEEAGMGSTSYNTPYGPAATAASGTPLGQVLDVAVGQVVYIPGSTNYWYLEGSANGPFLIFQRESTSNLKIGIDSPTTRSAKTATGASATSGTPMSGTQANYYTAGSATWTINVNVQVTDYSEVYGYPLIYYSALPTPQMRIGYLGMWAGYNNTNTAFAQGIEQSTPPTAGGYQAGYFYTVPANTPGYQNFVELLPPLESTPTTTGIGNFQIQVTTGSLNGQKTQVACLVWLADGQSTQIYSATTFDSAPTVYAPVAAYGLTATIYATGFEINGSNVPIGWVTYLTFQT